MIVASAIKFFYKDDTEHKFPQIWTGLRHADIFKRMYNMGVEYDKSFYDTGFLTNSNMFIDRYEAAGIAWDCGQISTQRDELYSEDLWPEEN